MQIMAMPENVAVSIAWLLGLCSILIHAVWAAWGEMLDAGTKVMR